MKANYNLYSKYYDLLYADKDYDSEASYVDKQIKALIPWAKSILEFGCGTGKHGVLLKKRGFEVFGLDQSAQMIGEAKKRGLPCKMADISDFKLKEKYDAIISLFHVVGYLTDNDHLGAMFSNAHHHLNKNGVFLFDLWYSPAVYEQKATTRIKKMRNKEIEVTRIADPKIDVNKNMVDVRYTIFVKDLATNHIEEISESHPVRNFSIPEIELLAKITGFEVKKTEELLTSNEPSVKTWGVCFILQKI